MVFFLFLIFFSCFENPPFLDLTIGLRGGRTTQKCQKHDFLHDFSRHEKNTQKLSRKNRKTARPEPSNTVFWPKNNFFKKKKTKILNRQNCKSPCSQTVRGLRKNRSGRSKNWTLDFAPRGRGLWPSPYNRGGLGGNEKREDFFSPVTDTIVHGLLNPKVEIRPIFHKKVRFFNAKSKSHRSRIRPETTPNLLLIHLGVNFGVFRTRKKSTFFVPFLQVQKWLEKWRIDLTFSSPTQKHLFFALLALLSPDQNFGLFGPKSTLALFGPPPDLNFSRAFCTF